MWFLSAWEHCFTIPPQYRPYRLVPNVVFMVVECTLSLSFRKTIYCCLNILYDCVVWLFKIIRNFKQNWDLCSKTYTFYCKVLGHSIMWVCHFRYLLHDQNWLNTFHIQIISRPHSCKGPRAWNSAAGRGAHFCVIPNNALQWPAPVLSVPCAPG